MRIRLVASIISLMKSRNKRVLIAMELRSYREAMAGALQGLCPDTRVFQAGGEPGPGDDAAPAGPGGVQPGHEPGRGPGPELG